jgi:hypothetical protein
MKKSALIPAFVFALCSTAIFAQTLPHVIELSASIRTKNLQPVKKPLNNFTEREMKRKPLIDIEKVSGQNAVIARKSLVSKDVVSVKAFPNPFVNDLSITINDAASQETFYEAVLFDLQGRKVFSQELAAKKDKLDLSGIAPGMYILHVQKNGAVILKEKLVKE